MTTPLRLNLNRRHLLLGAGAAGLAVAGLPKLASAQDTTLTGDITYWHHFTSESELAGLEKRAPAFSRPPTRASRSHRKTSRTPTT